MTSQPKCPHGPPVAVEFRWISPGRSAKRPSCVHEIHPATIKQLGVEAHPQRGGQIIHHHHNVGHSALIWLLWVLKHVISSRYRPFTGNDEGMTSVVVPVLDEPEELFWSVLTLMPEQGPSGIIVVIKWCRRRGARRCAGPRRQDRPPISQRRTRIRRRVPAERHQGAHPALH